MAKQTRGIRLIDGVLVFRFVKSEASSCVIDDHEGHEGLGVEVGEAAVQIFTNEAGVAVVEDRRPHAVGEDEWLGLDAQGSF